MSYIVWRLADADLNLWLPTDCDTFEQASAAWLECVQAGNAARITETVPIALRDAREQQPPQPPARDHRAVKHGARNNSRAAQIIKALNASPGGLSRAQISAQTGILKTDVGSTLAGLMKRNSVRTEQRPPSAELGPSAPGRETVTVYFWQGSE